MKKTIISILLVLVMLCSLSTAVFAESIPGADWTVTLTAAGKIVSSFDGKALAETLSGLQPGDDVTINIELTNNHKYGVDWYMLNDVLKTLEESASQGGGYIYELSYTSPKGATRDLFSSDRVGGEGKPSEVGQGLKEVNKTLENYFYLDSVKSGETCSVTLKVTLDGETQGNSYQISDAKLRMRFAVEIMSPEKIVRTSDDRNLLPFYIAMVASGALFLALGISGRKQRKQRKEESV